MPVPQTDGDDRLFLVPKHDHSHSHARGRSTLPHQGHRTTVVDAARPGRRSTRDAHLETDPLRQPGQRPGAQTPTWPPRSRLRHAPPLSKARRRSLPRPARIREGTGVGRRLRVKNERYPPDTERNLHEQLQPFSEQYEKPVMLPPGRASRLSTSYVAANRNSIIALGI